MTDRRLIESAFPLFEPLKPGRPARQTANVTVHRRPVTPVGASLLAIRSDGAQGGDFTARRRIREQARSYKTVFRH